uniref:Uncharacterized protein n=1 Tax=Plectus sambesii TaxID=2011161 RepID=A0A914VBI3_9BILA
MAANQAVEVDVSPGLSSSDTRDGLENEDETADSDSRLNSVPPMLSNCLDHDASNESPSVSPAVEDDATPSQCLKEREFDQDALNSEQHSPEVESTAMNSTSATDETGAEGDGVNCRNVSETERSLLQEALNGSNPLTKSSGDDVAVINHAQSKAIQSRNFSMRSTASSSSTSNNHGNELGLNQEASTTGLSKELRDNAMESCGTEASTSSKMMRKTVGKSNEANTQDTNDQQKPKKSISPIPDDPDVTIVQEKPRAAVTAQSLLNRIEATVLLFARAEGNNNQRKLTDVIMQALNQEVQRDPQGVQKILADKELRLPTAVTIPPSQ